MGHFSNFKVVEVNASQVPDYILKVEQQGTPPEYYKIFIDFAITDIKTSIRNITKRCIKRNNYIRITTFILDFNEKDCIFEYVYINP